MRSFSVPTAALLVLWVHVGSADARDRPNVRERFGRIVAAGRGGATGPFADTEKQLTALGSEQAPAAIRQRRLDLESGKVVLRTSAWPRALDQYSYFSDRAAAMATRALAEARRAKPRPESHRLVELERAVALAVLADTFALRSASRQGSKLLRAAEGDILREIQGEIDTAVARKDRAHLDGLIEALGGHLRQGQDVNRLPFLMQMALVRAVRTRLELTSSESPAADDLHIVEAALAKLHRLGWSPDFFR